MVHTAKAEKSTAEAQVTALKAELDCLKADSSCEHWETGSTTASVGNEVAARDAEEEQSAREFFVNLGAVPDAANNAQKYSHQRVSDGMEEIEAKDTRAEG